MDGQELARKKPRLSASIEVKTLPDGVRLVKQCRRATYMAVSPDEWEILGRFSGQKSVREVLAELLAQPGGFNVRRFYDLVMQGLVNGVLEDPDNPGAPAPPPATHWPIGWGAGPAIAVSLVIVAGGAVALGTTPVQLPTSLIGWFTAIVLVSLELSLAGFLQGCVLTGCGRVVYDFGWRWNRIIPYFGVDARDAFMGGRTCEVAVALQALAAPYLVAFVSRLAGSTEGLLAAYMGILALSSPFGDTPASRLLHALFRKEHAIPRCAVAFLRRRLLRQLFRWRADIREDRYVTLYAAYTLFWLGAVLRFGAGLLRRQGGGLVERFIMAQSLLERVAAGAVLAVLLAFVFVPVAVQVWLLVQNVVAWLRPYLFPAERRILARRRLRRGQAPAREEVEAFLADALLFSGLPREDVAELARCVEYVVARDGDVVVREGDRGDCLFVIYDGGVVVSKEDELGRLRTVAELGPGDVFGEIALLENAPRTATVRARGRTGLFVLNRRDFERLVVDRLGVQEVRRIIQVSGFLRRLPLFADWPDKAILELARAFSFYDVGKGEYVIRQDAPNAFFYIVYEGRFEVRKDGCVVADLGPGDFFGEISLLEQRTATADVVAVEPSRCLRIDRERFLDMVTGDAAAAYVVAATAEMREHE